MVDQGHCAGPREILLQRRLDCGVVCRLDLSLQDRDHRLEVVFRTLMNLRHDRLGGDGGRWRQQVDTARSEEHTSELQSLMRTSYAVFCLKTKNTKTKNTTTRTNEQHDVSQQTNIN